jgi:hypothetical protein
MHCIIGAVADICYTLADNIAMVGNSPAITGSCNIR